VEFRILGPLEVRGDGRPVALGGAKQRAVLVLLVLRAGELLATERIVDELWGDTPPPSATKTVQVYVSQLRKTLGRDVVETRGSAYVLHADDVDARRFERLLDEGRRLLPTDAAGAERVLAEALALWRGSPLADVAYERFAAGEIARLEELRLVAREGRLKARLALGAHAQAVPELEALVREQPLRESLRRLLMLALYRSGRQADALAAYQDARVSLVDELGLEPGPALQQLEQAILRQDPALELPRAEPPVAPAPPPPPAPAPPAATDARKTVSVLFCDVVASTRLAERLDPESLRAVLGRFLAEASAVVERHGGVVEHQAGDGLMAVFGVPVVREDDALRAAHAAVDLRAAVAERLPQLDLRIGVNTGEVVAGDGFVTGEAVNVAKRLEELAAPGEILIGSPTYELVAHAVAGDLLGPVELKGKLEPHVPFRLEAVDAEAPAFPRRDDTPLVGRAAELARLRAVFDEVEAGGGARLAVVVGDAGIGKSRLVRELLAGVGERAETVVGRCPPYGEGVTFLPLRELLARGGRDAAELGTTSHEIFAATREIVAALAGGKPLVAVFEDVHWAEPTFLDLVEHLQGRLGGVRVLLVCLARPELAELRPGWLQEPAVAVTLQPLSARDSERLLDELGVPHDARRRIADAAEGNPLFVEQLAALGPEDRDLPASVRGVLAERIDRLPPEARTVLECAAVVGRGFAVEQVLELCPGALRDQAHPRLLGLVRQRLLRPDFELPDGFRFQHALIRDAAYEAIPKATRAGLHERSAALVEGDALAGFHLEQAVRYREQLAAPPEATSALAARAGRLLASAARDAAGAGDVPGAVGLLTRAIALVPADDPERPSLLTELGAAQLKAGGFAEAAETLDAAVATASGPVRLRARLEREFLRTFTEPDRPPQVDELLPELERAGDELGVAKALWLASDAHVAACRWGARAEALERALEHARRAPDARDEPTMLTALLAQALAYGPAPVADVIARCEELLAGAGGDRPLRAALQSTLALARAMHGDIEEARALYADAVATYEELGLRLRRLSRALVGAQVESLAGDLDAAERELRLAYDALQASGERGLSAAVAAFLADLVCARGRDDEAEALAASIEAADHDVVPQVLLRSVRARVLARAGARAEAESLAREAEALAAATDFADLRAGVLLTLAEVADDPRPHLEAARAVYAAKGNVAAAAAVSLRLGGRDRVAPLVIGTDEEGT
jgi:class 3 adenylate cyclase/DNA-binding SARP family transcriptional activator